MFREFFNEEYRKILPFYWNTLIILIFHILFWNHPHVGFDRILYLLLLIHVLAVGGTIFCDYKTDSFLFSLPISRKKLFAYRYLTGLLFLLLTLTIIFLLIALGFRCVIQLGAKSPFFPMVMWYELNTVWSIGVFFFIAYSCFVYLCIWPRTFVSFKIQSRWSTFFPGFMLAYAIIMFMLALETMRRKTVENHIDTLLLIHFLVGSVLSIWISAKAYERMEIQS